MGTLYSHGIVNRNNIDQISFCYKRLYHWFPKKAREGNLKSFKIFEDATFVYGNVEEEKAG